MQTCFHIEQSKNMDFLISDVLFGRKRFFSRDAIAIKTKNLLSISKRGNLQLYRTKMSPNIKKLVKNLHAHPSL